MPYFVQLFQGIGDTLSQRHFVKRIAEVKEDTHVFTPWPQLFHDIPNLKFWFSDTTLRAQEDNILKIPKSFWAKVHRKTQPDLTIGYDDRHLATGMTMAESFARKIKETAKIDIQDYSLDLPLKPEWIEAADKIINGRPVCIVRGPTVRREWQAPSRNPKLGLMTKIVKHIPKDFIKIGVSYNFKHFEKAVENIPVDESYESGQLPIEVVAALMHRAKFTVTSVGFATLMGIAVKAKTLTVFGGHVAACHIYDKRMDLTNQLYIQPEPPCDCFNLTHDCNKEISLEVALKELNKLCQS